MVHGGYGGGFGVPTSLSNPGAPLILVNGSFHDFNSRKISLVNSKITFQGSDSSTGIYYTINGESPDIETKNGQYLQAGYEITLTEERFYHIQAVAVRNLKVSSVTQIYLDVLPCITDWTLHISNPYPSGGIANTKDALLDKNLDTGAASNSVPDESEFIEAQFQTPVVVKGVTLSTYTEDRWTDRHINDRDIEVRKSLTSGYTKILTISGMPKKKSFQYISFPQNFSGRSIRIALPANSDSKFIATGTLEFDFVGCPAADFDTTGNVIPETKPDTSNLKGDVEAAKAYVKNLLKNQQTLPWTVNKKN
eukprot:g1068.t1